jgi:hypothetical protein
VARVQTAEGNAAQQFDREMLKTKEVARAKPKAAKMMHEWRRHSEAKESTKAEREQEWPKRPYAKASIKGQRWKEIAVYGTVYTAPATWEPLGNIPSVIIQEYRKRWLQTG